ncbi:MAG: cytochrome c oxidase subunit II [Chloroflexota bacterium]
MSTPSRPRTGSAPLAVGLLVLAVIVVAVVILALAGITPQRLIQSFYPPPAATDRGKDTRALYDFVFVLAAAIFLFVEGWLVVALIRYRRRPGDDDLPPQTHGNNLIEMIWTIIPTAIVALLFFFSWQTLNKVDATTVKPQVRVQAEAARFQWTFHYFDENGKEAFSQPLPLADSGGGMVVPVGQTIHVTLRADDVIHAFYVPRFLFKRDAVPGKENAFDFTVEEPGTYRGQCAELCGVSHDAMLFDVKAVSTGEYQTWFQEQVSKAQATPQPRQPGPEPSGGQPGPGQAGGPTLELGAQAIAFSKSTLDAPANTPFVINFNNQDQGIPHNVAIKGADGAEKFKGSIETGPKEIKYNVPPLPAGQYTFFCSVHPTTMTGTLNVK